MIPPEFDLRAAILFAMIGLVASLVSCAVALWWLFTHVSVVIR